MNETITYPNRTKKWYQNGKLHRDNDLPAVTYPNGTKKWYQNGIKMVNYTETMINLL